MLERSRQGLAGAPVSEITAAAVSSHEVSIARTVIGSTTPLRLLAERFERGGKRHGVRRTEDAALRDDPGDIAMRRHVERGIADERAFRSEARGPEMAHLALVALLDRNTVAFRRIQIDGGQRRSDEKRN